jgi:hypothetical protein
MAKQPHNLELRRALLEVVENQLRDGTPAETRATLERLMGEGVSRDRAVELIACVVSCEIFDVLKSGLPYQEARDLDGDADAKSGVNPCRGLGYRRGGVHRWGAR